MIYLDSRYATGTIFKAFDARKRTIQLSVFRNFPTYSTDFFWYTWGAADRIDQVALKYLGDSSLWWQIMDINPEYINPLVIPIGVQIRIPNA